MLTGMKYFGGLTVKDIRTGTYYRIIGFNSYKTEKKLFHKPVVIPTYDLEPLSDGSRIVIDERVLERLYKVV